tara:strand:- start:872 stop:1060 length:189 start_codon:yes stop_codon:yes gene_type:complete
MGKNYEKKIPCESCEVIMTNVCITRVTHKDDEIYKGEGICGVCSEKIYARYLRGVGIECLED